MDRHHATDIADYIPEHGDLLLAMETRQLRVLAGDRRLCTIPRTLLGLYSKPPVPHLHDPYGLSNDYMQTSLTQIETAVSALKTAFPGASVS